MKLFAKSRDGLYQAQAVYEGDSIIVLTGSRINMNKNPGYKPSEMVRNIRDDRATVTSDGVILKDVSFGSLSAAATFVTGRVANGLMVWKTDDGKYVRYSLKRE